MTAALSAAAAVVLALFAGPQARGDRELEQPATWQFPDAAAVKAQLDAYLQERGLHAATRQQIERIWSTDPAAASDEPLLDRLAASLALADGEIHTLVDFCQRATEPASAPDFSALGDDRQPAWVRSNLRLLLGRWLAEHQLYDEALEQLRDLTPADVADPAALLFYLSASYHRMPDKRQCLPLVARLLEREPQLPHRYAALARLIRADLEPLETDSLDEISRLMDEVRRRLELQRAGTRVRHQEDEILAKLDQLIEKIEQQQQQQQAAAAAGSLQPANPAQDSMPMGGSGPGNVDPKPIGSKSGWGNLPPAARQEVLQQIGKDLPAHYREILEEYFRRLAREGAGP